jgi:hypothetical protein
MRIYERERILAQLNGKVIGPLPIFEMRRLKGFTVQTLVSYPGSDKWAPAFRALNLNVYEPRVAVSANFYDQKMAWGAMPVRLEDRTVPRVIHGRVASDAKPSAGWVDLWFRRLMIFNGVLILSAWVGWDHLPAQKYLYVSALSRMMQESITQAYHAAKNKSSHMRRVANARQGSLERHQEHENLLKNPQRQTEP